MLYQQLPFQVLPLSKIHALIYTDPSIHEHPLGLFSLHCLPVLLYHLGEKDRFFFIALSTLEELAMHSALPS